MEDNHQQPTGKRKLVTVRGVPGIFKILLWNKQKSQFVEARLVTGSQAKSYRAVKRVRSMGKMVQKAKNFYTIEEARAWRNEGNLEVLNQGIKTYLIRDLLKDWRAWSKPPRMAESTWQIYEKDVPHYQALMDIRVEELSSEDIDKWLQGCLHPSYWKKPTRVSFRREVKTLTTVLNWYREYKNSKYQSPILRRHIRDSFFKSQPVKGDLSLSVDQLEDFLHHLRTQSKPVYYYMACCQALSGLRIGEACGLFWECADLNHAILEVKRICYWDFKTKAPTLRDGTKTGEMRKVVIPPRLVSLLREWKTIGELGSLVFHREGELLRYNMVQSAYKKAYRACGLPVRSTHVLRHTFASIYADQTNDIRGTQAAMGHKDLRITQHYAKVAERTQRQSVEKFRLGQMENYEEPAPEPNSQGNVIPLVNRKQ